MKKENKYKLIFDIDDEVSVMITLKAKNKKNAIEKAKTMERKFALENPIAIFRQYED